MRTLLLAVLLAPTVSYGHHITYAATYCKDKGVVTLQKAEAFDSKSGERLGWWTARTLDDPEIGLEAWMADRMDDWKTHRGLMYKSMAGRCATS